MATTSFLVIVASIVVGVLGAVAVAFSLLRWLRVIQREHYEPGSVERFWRRWAATSVTGVRWLTWRVVWLATVIVAVVLVGAGRAIPALGIVAVVAIAFPPELTLRGRTSPLAWTRRLSTLAVVALAVAGVIVAVGVLAGRAWIASIVVVAAVPLLVDLAAWATRPYENLRARRFVSEAAERLRRAHPTIVAITGSFGKTSTKHHLAELLGGRHGVLPTPRSYNNRAGLSRAINENLTEGTRVFIAEMGIYGPGEIAEMCSWCPPDIAIVTAIGPVHLERMRTLEVVEAAKFEITERAAVVVLNVDDERLAAWVERLRASGKKVRTAGSLNDRADVRVEMVGERWRISVDGVDVGIAPPVSGVRETNLACAIAAALELSLGVGELIGRLAHLTSVPNRMVVATAPSGVMVIDDTFSANPSGAASSLSTLRSLPVSGRRVVVTPGMVELGSLQRESNVRLARDVASLGAELVVVGRTNAGALHEGYRSPARSFATREGAVEWVRHELRSGDAVLYLNDLPDHYP